MRARNKHLIRVPATVTAIALAGIVACAAARVGPAGVRHLEPVHADTAALRHKLDSIADAHHGIARARRLLVGRLNQMATPEATQQASASAKPGA